MDSMSTPTYNDTARALAAPISPPQTPPLDPQRPTFRRIASRSSRRATPTYYQNGIKTALAMRTKLLETYAAMSFIQRVILIVLAIVVNTFLILFLIYGHEFFAWLEPIAKRWRELSGGWTILFLMIVATAFPPMIGYSSLVTTSGFVFGFWRGWLICASAATLGSLCSFIACRTVLSKYVHGLVGEDKRFRALSLTLKHDGLKTLTLIRWCPLPYSLSNGALSTIPTLQPLNFALATLLSTPKLMIHVFVGTRLSSLAGGGGKMDSSTRFINYASIVGGLILGVVLGFLIYRKTKARADELEEEERQLASAEEGLNEREDLVNSDDFGNGMEDDDISLWDGPGDEHESAGQDRKSVV